MMTVTSAFMSLPSLLGSRRFQHVMSLQLVIGQKFLIVSRREVRERFETVLVNSPTYPSTRFVVPSTFPVTPDRTTGSSKDGEFVLKAVLSMFGGL